MQMITIEPPPAIYACSDSFYSVHCSILLSCQHIPCDDLHGCNVSCCRVFRRRVRCDRSLSCTQFCRGLGWTHLSWKLPQLSYLDGLQPYYCNKYSFSDTRCNKCVIELCYKSQSTVCVSNTNPGMTLKHRDYGPLGPGRYNYRSRTQAQMLF